jgi:hypothetical protein
MKKHQGHNIKVQGFFFFPQQPSASSARVFEKHVLKERAWNLNKVLRAGLSHWDVTNRKRDLTSKNEL